MSLIKESSIEAIRQRVSLTDVASSLVQLRQSGSLMKGLSPFNAEKTPSFFINPQKNVFHCYSSQQSGDLFTFVMLTENLTFYEAVETLARRYGVTLEYEEGRSNRESASLRSELFRIHESLTSLFQKALHAQNQESASIRKYWTEDRGFTLEEAKEFGVGYAPGNPSGLLKELQKENFSPEVWHQSGAFYSREGEQNLQRFGLRFSGRLMIPIRDIQGRVSGFTARATTFTPESPSKDAKYINSPETTIFKKSQLLFGLDHARKHLPEGTPLLVVEGQLDAIRCWSVGIHNVVAPQGTAITEQQLTLIRRYTNQVEFLLDGDHAGQAAAVRVLPMAWKAGLKTYFLVLGTDEDPDTLFRNQGIQALKTLREKRLGAVPFILKSRLPKGYHSDWQEKQKFFKEFYEYLSQIDRWTVQQDILRELIRPLGLSHDELKNDFLRFQHQSPRAGTNIRKSLSDSGDGNDNNQKSMEWDVLSFLLHNEELGVTLAHLIHPEWIHTHIPEGQLLNRFLAEFEHGEWPGSEKLDSILESNKERALISEILFQKFEFDDINELANHCLDRLFQRYYRTKLEKIDQQLKNPDILTDVERVLSLQKERQSIRKLLLSPPQLPETIITA